MQLFTWEQVSAQDKQGAASTSHVVLHLSLPKNRRKKSPPPSKVHPLTSSCSGEAWGAAAVGGSPSLSPSQVAAWTAQTQEKSAQELAVHRGLE